MIPNEVGLVLDNRDGPGHSSVRILKRSAIREEEEEIRRRHEEQKGKHNERICRAPWLSPRRRAVYNGKLKR